MLIILLRDNLIIEAKGVQHRASITVFFIVIKQLQPITYVVGLGGTSGESESESFAQVIDQSCSEGI